jgi:hypothetical protein
MELSLPRERKKQKTKLITFTFGEPHNGRISKLEVCETIPLGNASLP